MSADARPASVRLTLAEIRARAAGAPPPTALRPLSDGAPLVVPVHVALDRDGHHGPREDVLLPVNASDDAIAGIAAKLCSETGMPGHEAAAAAQVAEFLGAQRDAAAAARGATASRTVELTITARADGVRVTDRLLWDVASPASSVAAHAAATAADAGLGPAVAAALQAALTDAVARARRGGDAGKALDVASLDRGAAGAAGWGLTIEPDAGGWADAT